MSSRCGRFYRLFLQFIQFLGGEACLGHGHPLGWEAIIKGVVIADTDKTDIADGVVEAARTVKETLEYCLSVIQKRSDLCIDCKRIKLILNNKEVEV